MIRVGILGATGYTALELIKILLRHPDVEIVVATSRQEGNPRISSIHPQLAGRLELELENVEPLSVAARVDCVFSCLPHAASAASLAPILETDTRIVDFSADYRLDDAATYRHWYGVEHPDATRLPSVVYGLPELFRDRIADSRIVANPGCYPTAAILALAPLLKAGLIEDDIIVDSKSGVSGAGRVPKLTTHFPECNESISAYGVGSHRHTPELQQILSGVVDRAIHVVFTPHLVPMDRGILSTSYATARNPNVEDERMLEALRDFYSDEPFMRVVDHLPATKDTKETNFCDVTARVVNGRVIAISCLDNLIKGASGAAVQNFNLMFDLPETTAL